jgi:hypothetical protein
MSSDMSGLFDDENHDATFAPLGMLMNNPNDLLRFNLTHPNR